jgi:L-fuconolactonase
MLRIDAHHHLWNYNREEFAWLEDGMQLLQRDFLVCDLEDALASANVNAAIAVQARQSIAETKFLLAAAAANQSICGVVGWVPLRSPEVEAILDEFAGAPKLVGVREIAQGEPAGFFDDPAFNHGIEQLTRRGLAYDVLIFENQLEKVTRFVARHPRQKFVLDHAAKPKIAARKLEPWRSRIKELALQSNVSCKLSGLVTEAEWKNWTLDDLKPYLDTCVEAFGTDRLMAGSDWPVCLVATHYARWWKALDAYFAPFADEERNSVLGRNALDFYGVEV